MAPTTHTLRFADAAPDHATTTTSYSLLELPSELLSLLRSPSYSPSGPSRLELRGLANDEAVLVTGAATYALRSVQNSNSVMIVRADEGPRQEDQGLGLEVLHTVGETVEAVEVTKIVGDRLARLEELLDGTEYHGVEDEEDQERRRGKKRRLNGHADSLETASEAQRPGSNGHQPTSDPDEVPHITFETLQDQLRASDAEIFAALRRSRAVTIGPTLRRIPDSVLTKFLSSVLTALTALGISPPENQVDKQALLDSLDEDAFVSRQAAEGILQWYASSDETSSDRLKLDLQALVTDLGRCVLFGHATGRPIPIRNFLYEWHTQVGGSTSDCASFCDPSLLSSDAIFKSPTSALDTSGETIVPFPASELSPDPATRMRQLFAIREKWKEGDLKPFLLSLAGGEGKKVDALVLKYCRKIKEKVPVPKPAAAKGKGKAAEPETVEVTWLSARNNW